METVRSNTFWGGDKKKGILFTHAWKTSEILCYRLSEHFNTPYYSWNSLGPTRFIRDALIHKE